MTLLEGISLFVSAGSLALSLYVFFKNKLYSNASILMNIRDQVNQANSGLANARTDATAFSGDTSDMAKAIRTKYMESIATVLSVYENACILYYKHAVNRKNFISMFHDEINFLFQSTEFIEAIQKSNSIPHLTRFNIEQKR